MREHIIHAKTYLCAHCQINKIIHKKIEYPYEGEIPDICTCDFSKYEYEIAGGKLLKKRLKEAPETRTFANGKTFAPNKDAPLSLGGICEDCLSKEPIKNLIGSENILLEGEVSNY